MATTKRGQKTPRVAVAQIEDLMRSSGQRADAVRADGLMGLSAVKRAKLVQTRRERARLAVRYGEDSAVVARLDRQMAVEHRFLVNTRAEVDRVATAPLERDEALWQVHGFLRSQDGLGRTGYGVTLFADVDGRKSLAETSTDKRGYFHIGLEAVGPSGDASGVESAPGSGRQPAGKRVDDNATADPDKTEEDAAVKTGRAIRALAQALKAPAFIGVKIPGQGALWIDERPLHPVAGAIDYRDLTVANPKDDGAGCGLRTRLLGNASSRELHDLDNEKSGCRIAAILPDRRFYFRTIDQAEKLGYDFCAHCFGRSRSKR